MTGTNVTRVDSHLLECKDQPNVVTDENGEIYSTIRDNNLQWASENNITLLAQIISYFRRRTNSNIGMKSALRLAEKSDHMLYSAMPPSKEEALTDLLHKMYKSALSLTGTLTMPTNPCILDIGTEYKAFLETLSEVYHTSDVRGLNIAEWDHYASEPDFSKQTEQKVQRRSCSSCNMRDLERRASPSSGCLPIQMYDGYNIPFADDSFDLVTVFSVLHHVCHLEAFVKEIARVTKRYIFIKDHDIRKEETARMIEVQHAFYLYRHIDAKKGRIDQMDYLNLDISLDMLKKEFEKHRFVERKMTPTNGFSQVYYLILERV